MPMLYARRALYYICLENDSCWLSPFLIIAFAFRDKQNLATGMNMPIQLCAGIVGAPNFAADSLSMFVANSYCYSF